MLQQLKAEQVVLSLECFKQSSIFSLHALVLHPQAVQIPYTLCEVQTQFPLAAGMLHVGAAQNPSHLPCSAKGTFLQTSVRWMV